MTLSNPAQYISGRTVQEQMNSLIDYVDQRAADVALDAIASDVAQVHQDMLDADADATAAAASAAAAAGTLANAVKKTGEASQSIAGNIDISGNLDVGGKLDVTGDITGNNASLIGTVTVPTEATGTFTLKAANGTKVKNELDNYAPMVRTSGNQTIAGGKTLTSTLTIGSTTGITPRIDAYSETGTGNRKINIIGVGDTFEVIPATYRQYSFVSWSDENGRLIAGLRPIHNNNGTYSMQLMILNADGTEKYITLGSGNP